MVQCREDKYSLSTHYKGQVQHHLDMQQQYNCEEDVMKKTARYRAKLKAKKNKERLRKKGLLKVRTPGGKMKRIKRKTKSI